MLTAFKNKLKTFDNELLAILVASLLGLLLLIYTLIFGAMGEVLVTEWFLDTITVPVLYGSFIAGANYVGRLVNLLTFHAYLEPASDYYSRTLFNTRLSSRHIGLLERVLTPAGMLLGTVLASLCIACSVTVIPLLGSLSYLAYPLFILSCACMSGGLLNRIGSSLDGTRLAQEKKTILLGVFIGLTLALVILIPTLVTGGLLPLGGIAGCTALFLKFAALPKVLFSLIFIIGITNSTVSCADYLAKAYCFLRYRGNPEEMVFKQRLEYRYHEYRAALVGASIGLLVAVGILVGLAMTSSFFLTLPPMAAIATTLIMLITGTSTFAALSSRLGRLVDGFRSSITNQTPEFSEVAPLIVTPTCSPVLTKVHSALITLVSTPSQSSLKDLSRTKALDQKPPSADSLENRVDIERHQYNQESDHHATVYQSQIGVKCTSFFPPVKPALEPSVSIQSLNILASS